MKIIYCPPGHDPMDIARQHANRRVGGLGGGPLAENWWVILAVLLFVGLGVFAKPFNKGGDPVPQQAVAEPTATPTLTPFCTLPGGGMIMHNDTAWVEKGGDIASYRCVSGNLKRVEGSDD
jgi:hypothetical protein